ncbi:MAG: hypothetical protein ACRDNB_05610 [Gaiellaceae bacterium]
MRRIGLTGAQIALLSLAVGVIIVAVGNWAGPYASLAAGVFVAFPLTWIVFSRSRADLTPRALAIVGAYSIAMLAYASAFVAVTAAFGRVGFVIFGAVSALGFGLLSRRLTRRTP